MMRELLIMMCVEMVKAATIIMMTVDVTLFVF